MHRRWIPAVFVLMVAFPTRAPAAEPWRLAGWSCRAVVEVEKASDTPGCDTAAIRILCQGQVRPDGNDYRVLDADGHPIPFQLTFHDAARYSLLSFRAMPGKRPVLVYFGNPQAQAASEQMMVNETPGAGPPKGPWVPRYGMVLKTIVRPEGENPMTAEELAKMLAASPRPLGARYQRRIADAFNPFGWSDYYMSVYRGWINIPAAGEYRFCTASNEGSFSFLDGKPLVHWPGRHTTERGLHGEFNAAVQLTAGLHYLEYYHEEVSLQQMAFLGWSPPGQPKIAGQAYFTGIPESIFTAPHQARVLRYETPGGPALRFEPTISDSIWPVVRHEGQYTRVVFRVANAGQFPPATVFRWDFGDGQSAAGAEAIHVYLTLGRFPVRLSADGKTVEWPLEIYQIQHVTEQIKEGKPAEYAAIARGYDRGKLSLEALAELAHLAAEAGEAKTAIEVAKDFLEKEKKEKGTQLFSASQVRKVRRLMADCSIQLGESGLDEAIANYRAAIGDDDPADEKLAVLARLIRLVGIDRAQPDKVGEVLRQVDEVWKSAPLDEKVADAYRDCLIAAGDVLLWNSPRPLPGEGQGVRASGIEGAREHYRRAEALDKVLIPPQVRAAKVGSYPNTIREYIRSGDLGAALDVVARWEHTFPTEKLLGQPLYWHGKILALRGQHRDAARRLARAIALSVGAAYESEARWLLAQSLDALGKPEEAKRELARLIAAGLDDEFAKKAREKLAAGLGKKGK